MWLQNEDTLLNITRVKRYGSDIGEVVIWFKPQ